MKHLYMRKPSSWPGELWREALPLGNGLTGVLLSCGVGIDHIWMNRFDRWEDDMENLPDVSDAFKRQRELVLNGNYRDARNVLSDALRDRGYRGKTGTPLKPVMFRIVYELETPFHSYQRGINLDTKHGYVSFVCDNSQYTRDYFVSPEDDELHYIANSESPANIRIYKPDSDCVELTFNAHDATVEEYNDFYYIKNASKLNFKCAFKNCHPITNASDRPRATLTLSNHDSSNEDLLDRAYSGKASPELFEKLWYFGRYLFESGTCEQGAPFSLYGLWHGVENPQWAQNVANENVQMIYWHTFAGGLAHLVRPLIHYYYNKIGESRLNASRLFGCRGIFVSVYTTPLKGLVAPNVPVITNYIGCAGWLSKLFYDYYVYTSDEDLLNKEIIPFLSETALFYEDYAVIGKDGLLCLAPSVSPENTPQNLMPPIDQKQNGHPNPVVVDSTMDIAILKELLTNLLTLNQTHPFPVERTQIWKDMLSRLPEYHINQDGAMKEWQNAALEDNYKHRHLSHIYPLFPGDEVRRGHPLFNAFEKAVDLRKLGSQSGWSLAHMSAIYARLGRAEAALDCLDILSRSCLLSNFFTLHNDWRDMGLTINAHPHAPVQLDALMGAVNAIQEVLLRIDGSKLMLLPACPDRFSIGEFTNWSIPAGRISLSWNKTERHLSLSILATTDSEVIVYPPVWCNTEPTPITLKKGSAQHFNI